MKLTTKQLRQIIKEELANLMMEDEEKFADRFEARRAAGFDEETMEHLDSIESTNNYQDYVSAHELAASLGSEEKRLSYIEFSLFSDEGKALIDDFVEMEVDRTISTSPDRRVEQWQALGVDLDQYEEKPFLPGSPWEPLHVTIEQFTGAVYKSIYDQLWSLHWKNYPKIEVFEKEMGRVEPQLKEEIQKEIQKYVDSKTMVELDGILYSEA